MNRGREVKIGGHDRYSINLSRSRAILPRETLIKPRSTDVITVPCSHAGRKAWLMELLPSLPLRLTRKKDILYPFLFLYPAAKWKQPIFLPQLPSSSVFFHRGKRRQKEEKKSIKKRKILKEIEKREWNSKIIFQGWSDRMQRMMELMGRRWFVDTEVHRLVYSVVALENRET